MGIVKDIIKAEQGDPWEFNSNYTNSIYEIEFVNMTNFAKEGPLCGELMVNRCKIDHEGYVGFGGPILINGDLLYLTMHELRKSFFDSVGSYIIELNLKNKTIRVLGRKLTIIYINHIEDENIFFYNDYNKSGPTRSINIPSGKETTNILRRLLCLF